MVLTCPKCDSRLQLDEAKAPSHAFAVRCPKCQESIKVESLSPASVESTPGQHLTSSESTTSGAEPFAPPAAARAFKPRDGHKAGGGEASLGELVQLLAAALRNTEGTPSAARRTRPSWDRRGALVCASPAYRETIAESLTNNGYEAFVAENLVEALGRMRGERMDVVILDANFDPLEQGVAFITREVRLLRPSERRRLFFVYILSDVRTMDLHAAFLNNVNLVVNPSDVEQLPEALESSIRHYNELYRPLTTALNIAPL